MNIDEEVRTALLVRAEDAPSGAGLLDGVYARSRQLARRRRVGAVVVAAVAVLAILIPVGLLRPDASGPVPPPLASSGVSVHPSTSPPPEPGAVPLVLGPANYTLPAFPLKVGWQPPQIHFKVGLTGTEAQLRDEAQGLFVAVDSVEYDWDWEAASTGTTTINGRAATLRTGTDENHRPMVGVTWHLADGRWVTVDSVGGLPQAQVLRVARSITTGVTPATGLPFTLRYAPTGFVLANVLADGACFSPAQWPLEPRSLNGLCVWVESPTTSPGDDPDYGAVSLGGRPGHLLRTAYHWLQYWARLPDGRLLTITTSNGPVVDVPNTTRDVNAWLDISDADLATFIAGIAIGP